MNTNVHNIAIAENGPYLVSGSVPLALQVITPNTEGLSWDWVQGRVFQVEASYELCRCGASKTKPFCDGSHTKAGFEGTETASRALFARQAETYRGTDAHAARRPEPLRLRALLRSGRQDLVAHRADGRPGRTHARHPRSQSLPGRSIGRPRQEHAQGDRGAASALHRRRRRSGARMQRSTLGARRHRDRVGGRHALRNAEPRDAMPLRRLLQQTLLRRQPRVDQVRRRARRQVGA